MNTTTTQGDTTMNTTTSEFVYDRMVATRKCLEQHGLPEAIVAHCTGIVRSLHSKRAELALEIQYVQRTCERELASLNHGYRPNNLGIFHSSVTDANRIAAEIGMISDELTRVIYMITQMSESCKFSRDELLAVALGTEA